MPAERLRPVDLARGHGLSTQAIRNYEAAGVLPPSDRTQYGYRVYTQQHVQALRAFAALIPAHGHQTATAILHAVNQDDLEGAFGLIDESHQLLQRDRQTLGAVEEALRDLPPVQSQQQPQPEAGMTFVGALARRLRIRPATLRKWERAGLLHPRRDPRTGYRVYGPVEVRDAELVHQLRRGGYLLSQIAPLLDQVRAAGGVEPLAATLTGWRNRLTERGRAMLAAAAALDAYLSCRAPAAPPAER